MSYVVFPSPDENGAPRLVLDHNGAPIPINGVQVPTAELWAAYYEPLVNSGALSTQDPYGTGLPPSVLAVAGPVLAVDTDAILAAMRGPYDRAQARTTGAVVPNAGDGDTWNWSETYPGPYDADHIGPELPGAWIRDTSSGLGTLAGDTDGPSASNTLQRIRSVPLAAGTPAAGKRLRVSPAAGTTATCTATFAASPGTSIPTNSVLKNDADPENTKFFLLTAGGSESGGSITVTFRGDGTDGNIASGATIKLCVPITGVTTAGVVGAPGIVGLTDAWVPYDTTQARHHLAYKKFNGDARPGVFAGFGSSAPSGHSWGMQAALNDLRPGDTFDFGPAGYTFNEQLYFDKNLSSQYTQVRFIGAGSSTDSRTVLLSHINDPTKALFRLASDRCYFQGIRFQCQSGALASLMDLGPMQVGQTITGNFNRFDGCSWYYVAGACPFGFSFAHIAPQAPQLENATFDRCAWNGFHDYAVYAADSGQPYTMNFNSCTFFGRAGLGGWAARLNRYSLHALFNGCDFQALEGWVWLGSAGPCATIINPQSETCKKIAVVEGSIPNMLTIINGRINPGYFTTFASLGPIGYPVSNGYYIEARSGGSVSLVDTRISLVSGEQPGARILLESGELTTVGNVVLPCRDAFKVQSGTPRVSISPNTTYTGVGGVLEPVDYLPRGGALNDLTEVAFYDDVASQRVPWGHPENSPSTVAMRFDIQTLDGSPADGAYRAELTDSTATDFEVTLAAAPGTAGSGDGVLVRCSPYRAKLRYASPADVGTLFADWDSRYDVTHSDVAGVERASLWEDQVSGKVLSNATAATRWRYEASKAELNGLPTVYEDASGLFLSSNLTAADWAFLNNPAEAWTLAVVSYNVASANASMGTTDGPTRGMQCFPTYPSLFWWQGSTSDTVYYDGETPTKRWMCAVHVGGGIVRLATSQNRVWGYQGGAAPDGVLVVDMTAGNPAFPLRLRSFVDGCHLARILIWKSALSRLEWEGVLNGSLNKVYGGFP